MIERKSVKRKDTFDIMNKPFRFEIKHLQKKELDVTLFKKIFSSKQINPFTRKHVDLRGMIENIIEEIKEVLSLDEYDTIYTNKNQIIYDFLELDMEFIENLTPQKRQKLLYNPDNNIECLVGLYIGDNVIIERTFVVENYNPIVRWSNEILETGNDITDRIEKYLIEKDKKNIWDDYYLNKKKNIPIIKIWNIPIEERERLLDGLYK